MSPGKQNENGACSNNKLEFNYFLESCEAIRYGVDIAKMSLVYCKPRGGEGRGGGRKNKMEQQTYPHPPKKKDKAARTPRRIFF